MDLLQLLMAAALVLANAFFVMVEFSIVKTRLTRLEELSAKGYTNATVAKELVHHLDEYLSATQLGITIASLGLGWIGEPAMARLLEPWVHAFWPTAPQAVIHGIAFGVAFVAITFLHVILGELMPKSIAIQYSERSAMLIARPMRWFYRAFYWPLTALNRTSNLLLRLIGFKPASGEEMVHSEEELRMLISSAEEHGKFPLRRLLLFENMFDFASQKVKDVMTPRDNVDFLSSRRIWEENLAVIRTRRQTRYPLCEGSLDQSLGYVHMMDVAVHLTGAGAQEAPDLMKLRRDLPVVREDAALESVLTDFQLKKLHMALVKTAAGQVVGLVTMEDILEELVGEIRDEFEPLPAGSLSELWVPEALLLDLQALDRSEAIRKLLQKLHDARPDFDLQEAYEIIWKREQGLTSAIGSEMALPHGRLPSLAKAMVAIGHAPAGIPFDAPDKRPVKLLFLILTPLKEPVVQLRILSKIATLMMNRALKRRLLKARNAAEVAEVLRVFESGLPA